MSIATQTQRIVDAKASIKTAIEAKGVGVGAAKLDQYASKINNITSDYSNIPVQAAAPAPWVPPVDWIDISTAGNNEINLLVSDGTGIGFKTYVDSKPCTYNSSLNTDTFTFNNHGFVNGNLVRVQYNLAGIFTVDTVDYYVISATTNTLKLSLTLNGAAIIFSGIGTVYLYNTTNTYSIDWGDGIVETGLLSGVLVQHQHIINGTLCSEGYNTWKVRIYGALGNITGWKVIKHTYTARAQYPAILSAVFGTNNIINYANTFYVSNLYCKKLRNCVISSFQDCVDTNNMFCNCSNLASVILPTTWGSVVNAANMFSSCTYIQAITLPTSWDSLVTLTSMFQGCVSLYSLTLPDSWGLVTSVVQMFYNTASLNTINLPADWGLVSSTVNMFYSCCSLSYISIPSTWGLVASVDGMFTACISIQRIVLPNSWGSIGSAGHMFEGCTKLNSVNLPMSWGNITTTTYMFCNTKIGSIILPLTWDNVNNVSHMFELCTSLQSIILPISWGNMTSVMSMFYNCQILTSINLPTTWSTNITDLTYFFSGCNELTSVSLPVSWRNVTLTSNMFYNCISLKSITLPVSWGSITNATQMFYNCYSLIKVGNTTSWASLTNASWMFYNCANLSFISLPTTWANISDASYMFSSCITLTKIIMPTTWVGQNINCLSMFSGCFSLVSITLPSVMGNIWSHNSMFTSCYSLKTIDNTQYLGSLSTNVDFADLFRDCEFLQSSISIASLIAKIGVYSYNSSYKSKLTSLRLTNASSTFGGSSPQIDVSYTDMSDVALNLLFGDLPTIGGKTIKITGSTGAATCTKSIATAKGWTVTG